MSVPDSSLRTTHTRLDEKKNVRVPRTVGDRVPEYSISQFEEKSVNFYLSIPIELN